MEQDEEAIQIVFRKWPQKEGEEVLALFPYMQEHDGMCLSYQHVGQHGEADYMRCIARTRPCYPGEFDALKRELEGLGYRLDVRKRKGRKKVSERG